MCTIKFPPAINTSYFLSPFLPSNLPRKDTHTLLLYPSLAHFVCTEANNIGCKESVSISWAVPLREKILNSNNDFFSLAYLLHDMCTEYNTACDVFIVAQTEGQRAVHCSRSFKRWENVKPLRSNSVSSTTIHGANFVSDLNYSRESVDALHCYRGENYRRSAPN